MEEGGEGGEGGRKENPWAVEGKRRKKKILGDGRCRPSDQMQKGQSAVVIAGSRPIRLYILDKVGKLRQTVRLLRLAGSLLSWAHALDLAGPPPPSTELSITHHNGFLPL